MLKSLTGPLAVAALLAAGVVAAQTTTSPSERQAYPNSSSQSTTTTESSSTTTTNKSHKQAMKDCLAQQEQNHPSMSKSDMKKACKSQVESSSSSTSPHE